MWNSLELQLLEKDLKNYLHKFIVNFTVVSMLFCVYYSQTVWGSSSSMAVPTAIKAQLLSEGTHKLQKGHSWSTWLRGSGSLRYWAPHITHSLYKVILPSLGYITDLIHRNKNREAAKMGRQKNMFQMKDWEKFLEKILYEMETADYLL